jgi:DNA-binding LytR/AlgR family response regulator
MPLPYHLHWEVGEMLRVLIVEDEADAAALLRDYIEKYCQAKGIEVEVRWQRDAIDLVRTARDIDLLFLDIELPLTNGMEAATLLRAYDTETPIIFVTNLAQYAVRGYEVSALDFIVKPVHYSDFRMRMDKAMRVVRRNDDRTIVVRTRNFSRVIHYADLIYIDTAGHNVAFHVTDEDEPIVARDSLSNLEKRLADGSFVRISGSCIVNMRFIRLARGSELALVTGQRFTISRNKKAQALATINRYLGKSL